MKVKELRKQLEMLERVGFADCNIVVVEPDRDGQAGDIDRHIEIDRITRGEGDNEKELITLRHW